MFSIKPTKIEDVPLIRNLALKIWPDTYRSILSEEQISYMFEMMYSEENLSKQMLEAGHRFFIGEIDGVPSGYISVEKRDEKVYNLQKIYVLSSAQGTGFGRYLVEQVIARLKDCCEAPFTIELFVNRQNRAVGFYKRIGFEVAGTRDHCIGGGYYMNDYIMTLRV